MSVCVGWEVKEMSSYICKSKQFLSALWLILIFTHIQSSVSLLTSPYVHHPDLSTLLLQPLLPRLVLTHLYLPCLPFLSLLFTLTPFSLGCGWESARAFNLHPHLGRKCVFLLLIGGGQRSQLPHGSTNMFKSSYIVYPESLHYKKDIRYDNDWLYTIHPSPMGK